MMLGRLTTMLAASALATAPVIAQTQAAPPVPQNEQIEDASALRGNADDRIGWIMAGLVFVAVIVVLVLIITEDDDDEASVSP